MWHGGPWTSSSHKFTNFSFSSKFNQNYLGVTDKKSCTYLKNMFCLVEFSVNIITQISVTNYEGCFLS